MVKRILEDLNDPLVLSFEAPSEAAMADPKQIAIRLKNTANACAIDVGPGTPAYAAVQQLASAGVIDGAKQGPQEKIRITEESGIIEHKAAPAPQSNDSETKVSVFGIPFIFGGAVISFGSSKPKPVEPPVTVTSSSYTEVAPGDLSPLGVFVKDCAPLTR